MATKECSSFPKAPALLEPHHQIVQCDIQKTRWGSLTPLQRCSRCILQPKPTEQTVKWFQVFLYNSYNLSSIICLHTVCSIWTIDRIYQVLPLRVRVDLGVMLMKRYFIFLKAPGLEPHHQFDVIISRTRAVGVTHSRNPIGVFCSPSRLAGVNYLRITVIAYKVLSSLIWNHITVSK